MRQVPAAAGAAGVTRGDTAPDSFALQLSGTGVTLLFSFFTYREGKSVPVSSERREHAQGKASCCTLNIQTRLCNAS